MQYGVHLVVERVDLARVGACADARLNAGGGVGQQFSSEDSVTG
ncbi:hypothetical protein [Streptomyces filipinensis]|nr:hypothetical protein [Streptomyces filipinensis]